MGEPGIIVGGGVRLGFGEAVNVGIAEGVTVDVIDGALVAVEEGVMVSCGWSGLQAEKPMHKNNIRMTFIRRTVLPRSLLYYTHRV